MAVPTLFVMGDAEREIVPDRVVVSVTVQTPVLHSSQEALSWAAQARRRVIDHLEGALPGAAISDGRITTREEQRRVEEERPGRTETRWEVAGDTGLCLVVIEDAAARASGIVASAGSHRDATNVSPAFEVGPELARRVRDELEREAVRDALARAEGLAAAAGLSVGPVVSIGEHGPRPEPRDDGMRIFASHDDPSTAADELEEALGELRPEPELRRAQVPVRVALA